MYYYPSLYSKTHEALSDNSTGNSGLEHFEVLPNEDEYSSCTQMQETQNIKCVKYPIFACENWSAVF